VDETAVDISLLMNAPTNFSHAVPTEVLLVIKFCGNVNSVLSGTLKMEALNFFETWITVYRSARLAS
jgi:hypothetical protein